MRDLDIDAIEQRANAATPGPWRDGRSGGDVECLIDGVHCQVALASGAAAMHDVRADAATIRRANAAFIAHAREDVPALIEALKWLRKVAALVTFSDGESTPQPDLSAAMARTDRADGAIRKFLEDLPGCAFCGQPATLQIRQFPDPAYYPVVNACSNCIGQMPDAEHLGVSHEIDFESLRSALATAGA